MAAKIVRQINKIVLLGAPTSAAALSAGHEAAPAALRAAGLADRLRSAGYDVADLGDDTPQIFKVDDESPRARNLRGVVKSLESLKPRVEEAVKSAALPVILGGDCSIALATIAGARRYFRHVSLIYMDRDADLHTPATTSSGCVDGMVVSHLTGRGAAEMVRFWGEPPLVRDPDLALFGVERIEPTEEEALRRSTMRSYLAMDVQRKGAAASAEAALASVHGNTHEFVLHLDVDVIEDFAATNYPGSGGLRMQDVREALEVFAKQKNLAAIEITAYNPAKDAGGSLAKAIVDLLSDVLAKRLEALQSAGDSASASAPDGQKTAGAAAVEGAPAATERVPPSAATAGEAWSSDSLEEESPVGESAAEETAAEETSHTESSSSS